MQDLPLILLIEGAHTRLMHSALPGAATVPDRPPGRLRLLVARELHRLATRLDRGLATQAGDGRTAPAAVCVR